eukprot:403344988
MNNKITFENVIKKTNFDRVVRYNKDKLFSYDSNLLFGHNKDAYKDSLFSQIMPQTSNSNIGGNQQRKLQLPNQNPFEREDREGPLIKQLPPSEIWKRERYNEMQQIDKHKLRQISIFDTVQNVTEDSLQRMNTAKKLQLYEQLNENAFAKEETPERLVVLNSDNYLGTVNCILHCLMKTLPLKQILKKFTKNQIQKNEASKYEGVVLEQMSEFFANYDLSQKNSTYSELMDPQFKVFYKRDPFEMLTFLLSGMHDDLNRAPNRGQIAPSNSYPAFENQGIVELDYIQAERWDSFFKQRDESPILEMFQGRILKHIQCLLCYNPKLIFENFMSLTLNLKKYPREETISLSELIVEHFTSRQNNQDSTLFQTDQSQDDGITQFYCLKCRRNAPYKKELSIWKFPKFLIIQIQRFESFVNKVNSMQHNVYYPVDSLDLRKFAKTSKDESAKKAVYNLYGSIQLAGFLNANKFNANVYNCKEDKWYQYQDQEKVSQTAIESPNALTLKYD